MRLEKSFAIMPSPQKEHTATVLLCIENVNEQLTGQVAANWLNERCSSVILV